VREHSAFGRLIEGEDRGLTERAVAHR
jgi:hypothetical protein